ncbi:hypothetical protein [Ferrovibrio sp.]|uniref:hypothetical protein n=1 Tax=Ferrovibrio sp. TaxID=1917215 RepID=UPI0025BC4CCB|nr:hypothetical protein [Ferrovibrio sp.]MBX3455719.1 hypothetical protein [Ferrovibrio sp.]
MLNIGLVARCRHCGHEKRLELRALADALGPTTSTVKLAERLTCVNCGQPGSGLPHALLPEKLPERRPVQGAFSGSFSELPG